MVSPSIFNRRPKPSCLVFLSSTSILTGTNEPYLQKLIRVSDTVIASKVVAWTAPTMG